MSDNIRDLILHPDEILTYLRKSRADHPDESVDEVLRKHELQLREYARQTFHIELEDAYILREVISGETIEARPQIQKLLKLIESPRYKAVFVIEPQRLSRGDLEDCGRLINTLRFTKTIVITPVRTYNLEDKYDRKFFEMELTRGNDYLEYTKEILRRGVLASVKQGNYIASSAPYGYRKVSLKYERKTLHTLEIIPEEAAAVQMMYDLYLNRNFGFQKIANYLDEMNIKPRISKNWSPAAIKDMIENPVYTGKIRWNHRKTVITIENGQKKIKRPKASLGQCMLIPGLHKPIISEELYGAAMEKKGKNICVRRNFSLENPLAGLLFCQCGYSMSYKYNHQKSNPKAIMVCSHQTICHTRSVSYNEILKNVIQCIEKRVEAFEVEIENAVSENAEHYEVILRDLECRLAQLYQKNERQKDSLDDGIYSRQEYLERNKAVRQEIEKTLRSIETAKNNIPKALECERKKVGFEEVLQTLWDTKVPAEIKNMLLKKCVKKIVYKNTSPSGRGIGRYSKNVFSLEVYFCI